MRLLLLGGPRFLGRAVVDAALARGHEVTMFNRGTTNPDLYPEVGDAASGPIAHGDTLFFARAVESAVAAR